MTVRAGRWRRAGAWALFVAMLLLLGACVDNFDQTPVDAGPRPMDALAPEGRFAVEVDSLWNLVFMIAVAVFVLVQGLIIYSLLRFRERKDDDGTLPKQVHGNPRLEVLWTIIPAVILAVIAVPTVRTIWDLADEPEDMLRVEVIGHQWWWEFRYEDYDGLVTANELHIPTGRTVFLEMTSADVIHSFWIPKLNGKQDTVPGRTNGLKIEAQEQGEYFGQCAEYCGLSHANMRVRVIAQDPAAFEEWAQQQSADYERPERGSLAAAGERLFLRELDTCINCHSIRGSDATATTGPDLTHFASREWFAGAIFENTHENLAQWLDDPPEMKPMAPEDGLGMQDYNLTKKQIDALVAFLMSLE